MIHSLLRACACLLATVIVLGSAPVRAAEPYDIYAIISLTGPLALLGADEQASLKIVESIVNKGGGINGRPIRFVISDDQSQPAVAVQLANGIIAKGVPILFGPSYTPSCLAVMPLIRANGPLSYCFSPALHPAAGTYMFSASISSYDQGTAILAFAQSKGWRRVAIVATTDASGVEGEAQLLAAASLPRFANMSIVDREHYAVADVSISAQATRVKAAAPDVIVMTSVGTPTGTALRAFKDTGLEKTPVIANFGNLLHDALNQYATFIPDQLYLTAPRFVTHDVSRPGPVRDAQLSFYKAMGAAGINPDVPHNLPWDVALVLIDALRHLGTSATAKQILDYLEPLHGFAGTNGIYDFRDGSQRGIGLTSVAIVRWNPTKKDWATVSEIGGKAIAK